MREQKAPHTIRFPSDLYRLIHEMAAAEQRTFNQEVIYLLTIGVKTVLKGREKENERN